MSRAEEKYNNMYKSEFFRPSTEVHICETYIIELKEEIRQKDELILKLERKGY